MHSNRMIDKRTGESLDPEDDCTHKFQFNLSSLYRP